jgi:hypothetical protein
MLVDEALQCVAQIHQQVKAVGNLNRFGRAFTGCTRVLGAVLNPAPLVAV